MRELRLWALTAPLAMTIAACGSGGDGDPGTGDEQDVVERVGISTLLSDDELRGDDDVTVEQVQDVLDKHRSFLATFEEQGKRASEIIVEHAKAHNVSPVYMLARIQGESSLIQSGTSRNLSAATGCACPDGSACSGRAKGFTAQVECAAVLIESYFEELESKGQTRTGWKVGQSHKTLDPCTVTPTNKATAALYTYTPWVGKSGRECGRRDVLGSTTLVGLYRKYAGEIR